MGHDVVIVGGGVVGSSVAAHLAVAVPTCDIVVVERDPSYAMASTTRSAGNVRMQFGLRENVLMSLHTDTVLDQITADVAADPSLPDPAPRRQGNLFLVDGVMERRARDAVRRQQALGCSVEWWEPDDVSSGLRGLEAIGVAGASYGSRDGAIDPAALLAHYRRRAASRGVKYLYDEVERLRCTGSRVAGIELASGARLDAGDVVVCAGAWSTRLLATAGIDAPVDPVMRTMFVVDATVRADGMPSVFLPSRAYLLPETGTRWMMGRSTERDPIGFDFTPHPVRHFEDVVWPEIMRVLPAFDELRVVRAWAGLYAVNRLDGNAILGRWPGVEGLLLATGFSGHGLQHAPAMGRYLAELVMGARPTLDLSRLGPQRIVDADPLREDESRLI